MSDSPGNGVLGSLDFPEELLRVAVIEGELTVDHCIQEDPHCPHITGFPAVRLA